MMKMQLVCTSMLLIALSCQHSFAASLIREERGNKPLKLPAEQGPFYGDLATYLVVNVKQDWGDAKLYCEASGGWLVQPDSRLENILLTHMLIRNGIIGDVWIGLGDTWMEEELTWSDGRAVNYNNLAISSGNSASKDCGFIKSGSAVMLRSGFEYPWYFEKCGRQLQFVCQFPAGCPDGSVLVNCIVDPCDRASCDADPEAVCRANRCGGCHAEFYNSMGALVDCQGSPADEKPGICPVTPGTGVGTCSRDCNTDYDCKGKTKCCFNGCSHICTSPI